jgi:hypothetical protein
MRQGLATTTAVVEIKELEPEACHYICVARRAVPNMRGQAGRDGGWKHGRR